MKYGAFFLGSSAFLALLAWGVRRLSRRAPGPWRSRGINAGLVLIALLTPFVAAEGLFLFFVDSSDDVMSTLTSRRWTERHAPRAGVPRGRHSLSPRSPSTSGVSLAVFGDSITFGQGIADDRDLYPSILERELRARGIAADVLNVSVQGWNTPQEISALQTYYASGQSFDIVVLGFCLNDMGEYVEAAPGFHETLSRLKKAPPWLAPLVNNSFVASYLYVRYVSRTSPAIRQTWEKVAEAYRSPGMIQLLVKKIGDFEQLVASRGGRLVILTFPDSSGSWEKYRFHEFHRKFGSYWKWAGVTQIDLLPVFSRYPPQALQTSFMDSHPGKLAHRLAAEALTEAVSALLRQRPGSPAQNPTAN